MLYYGGFSGEESPLCVFPNCIGFLKNGIYNHEFFISSKVQDNFLY